MTLNDFYDKYIDNICECCVVENDNDRIETATDGNVIITTVKYHNNVICIIRRSVYDNGIEYATSSCGWNTISTARRINNILARLHDPVRFHYGKSTGYYKGTELIVKGNEYFSEGYDL